MFEVTASQADDRFQSRQRRQIVPLDLDNHPMRHLEIPLVISAGGVVLPIDRIDGLMDEWVEQISEHFVIGRTICIEEYCPTEAIVAENEER